MSEFMIVNGNKNLIVCFGGMNLQMYGIPPFEFLNYLSTNYKDNYDLLFYIDKHQKWYHKGIDGISTTINETCEYLNTKISQYEKVIFMGTSSGGYAAILFGSLCKVTNVVAFIPQTKLINPISREYRDLKTIINPNTKYLLYGDLKYPVNDTHHISQCENLESFSNVKIIKKDVFLKHMRDSGEIKEILDSL